MQVRYKIYVVTVALIGDLDFFVFLLPYQTTREEKESIALEAVRRRVVLGRKVTFHFQDGI